ncbi:hypothetical protein HFX_5286 (plasmid) [Haloferax mediterranei ATCC 33500]|uniref:Uncharacterized protein n=1 Tax=Haloferax mediterranei (strain ATCC 33500 / DSM 1411 / JCM 8866 / NBRC 14739 / NCIMB 2177 / R-4) TaxID=523841 RepID=I3RA57_HALMT|nr:hypothetical protein HFX_5286 [Haloferax mediterranei ATCC 33500]
MDSPYLWTVISSLQDVELEFVPFRGTRLQTSALQFGTWRFRKKTGQEPDT